MVKYYSQSYFLHFITLLIKQVSFVKSQERNHQTQWDANFARICFIGPSYQFEHRYLIFQLSRRQIKPNLQFVYVKVCQFNSTSPRYFFFSSFGFCSFVRTKDIFKTRLQHFEMWHICFQITTYLEKMKVSLPFVRTSKYIHKCNRVNCNGLGQKTYIDIVLRL